jgi:hypothetical protein
MLEVALGHHTVTATGRVAAKLEIFLEQLLRRSADAEVGPVAVEHVVAVHRNAAAATTALVSEAATATATTAAAATGSMAASTHAFHIVHTVAVTPSHLQAGWRMLGRADQPIGVPGAAPSARLLTIGIGTGEHLDRTGRGARGKPPRG